MFNFRAKPQPVSPDSTALSGSASRAAIAPLRLLFVVLAMLVTFTVFSAPSADAQAAAPVYGLDQSYLLCGPPASSSAVLDSAPYATCYTNYTGTCPAGSTRADYFGADGWKLGLGPGQTTYCHVARKCAAGTSPVGVTTCRPTGHRPIDSQADCNAQPAGLWLAGARRCAKSLISTPTGPNNICYFGMPVNNSGQQLCVQMYTILGGNLQSQTVGVAVCIESNFVQNDPAAADGRVGTTFTSSSDGHEYIIHNGKPTCSFNCSNGFDINCDGKLGDFCPVELDPDTVKGAGKCLALMASKG